MSTSNSFTAIGAGTTFTLPVLSGASIGEAGPNLPFAYAITGTFVATLILEATQNNGETWTTLLTTTTTTSGTGYGPGTFRWRCTAFTSGTAVATLSANTYTVQSWKNSEQATVFTIRSDGVSLGAISPTSVAASGTITGSNLIRGAGSPEGAVTASVGTLYERTDGGSGTSAYIKESGAGNTGWTAISGGGGGGISGSGTSGTLPIWSDSTTLSNSVVTYAPNTLTMDADILLPTARTLNLATGSIVMNDYVDQPLGLIETDVDLGTFTVRIGGNSGTMIIGDDHEVQYNGSLNTFLNTVIFPAGDSATGASYNIPAGEAPSSPNDGDVWREDNTNTGLKIRINGVTKTVTLT